MWNAVEPPAKVLLGVPCESLRASTWFRQNLFKLNVVAGAHDPYVTSTDVTWVREITHDELQNIATGKEKRIQSYRQRCSDVWLLIVVNGFRISSMAQLPKELREIISSFDRAFVLHDDRAFIELP